MLQAVLYGAGDLRFEHVDLDVGRLRPDEIYVETIVSAFSTGTDLGNYSGDSSYVPGAPGYPRAVGYSNVGRVVRTGAGVRRWRNGHRVFSTKPHQSAYVVAESDLLVAVPDNVPSAPASLAYLSHLGLTALRQAHYEPGERVTVVGLGVIGLCTVAVARVLGAEVTAIANSCQRGEAARLLGAHHVRLSDECSLDETGDADVVVLAADRWHAYRIAVALARAGGRVSILGFPGRAQPAPDFNPLDPKWLYAKQLSLIGAGYSPAGTCRPEQLRSNLARDLNYLMGRMSDGSLSLESLISHRLPAKEMQVSYELARSHDKNLLAAVFVWRDEEGT